MTPGILSWLEINVKPALRASDRVLEIGALNVNGSARDVLQGHVASWLGLDRTEGPGVDLAVNALDYLKSTSETYDVIIACECYEHDPFWWRTHEAALSCLSSGGLFVVTTPTLGFPYHSYGGDFYRFTEDAYRQAIFDPTKFNLLSLVKTTDFGFSCLCGMGKKLA